MYPVCRGYMSSDGPDAMCLTCGCRFYHAFAPPADERRPPPGIWVPSPHNLAVLMRKRPWTA